MFPSGIADEAGKDIDTQVRAHTELGWKHIEIRTVDGVGLTLMPDDKFNEVFDKVTSAGLRVSCFASALCNWSRPITTPFEVDVEELLTAIPRMHCCGCKFIRVMSYPNDKESPWEEAEWHKAVVRRLKLLAKIAEDGGVMLVHENCDGWGGLSAENSLQLLEDVNSPAFKLLYDTGNCVSHGQDPWDFYTKTRDETVYVHIKDAKAGVDGKERYAYCGDGDGRVLDVITDLLKRGYDDGFSIEPHLSAIIHEAKDADDPEAGYRCYVEYGRRLMALLDKAKAAAGR